MNYDEFKTEVVKKMEIISEQNGYTVDFDNVLKNNGQRLDAIIIKPFGSKVASTIYLNEWYKDYLRGKVINEVCNDIFSLAKRALEEEGFPRVPKISWENIKDELFISVINADANEELLKETPHRRMEDLAMIARINVKTNGSGSASIRVTNNLLSLLTKTKDEVMMQAISNTEKKRFTCTSIIEVICDLLGDESEMFCEMFPDEKKPPMYVVTLPNNLNGASILACKDTLADIVTNIDTDVYILPSSINEVLLIPTDCGIELEELQDMVHKVNKENVPPSEVLSDNVYHFNAKNKKFSIAVNDIETPTEKFGKAMHKSM